MRDKITKSKIIRFKKALKLRSPIIGVEFASKVPKEVKHFKDTACTALARVKNGGIDIHFDFKKHCQLCSGADYFLGSKKITDDDVKDVYVKDEHVFENKKICNAFLKAIPVMPGKFIGKKIIIRPFRPSSKSQVIILFVNSAQAGRILGLLNYSFFSKVEIYPCQSTCLAFFAPLVTEMPHINFIDYYDRYFQGKINGKYLWKENEMIISLDRKHFSSLIENVAKSPHGGYARVRVDAKKVDPFE